MPVHRGVRVVKPEEKKPDNYEDAMKLFEQKVKTEEAQKEAKKRKKEAMRA